MLKIQEGLDLIIEHYINELREARRGERHTIPDRYALTILEDTEAIRNYVKPVLADRIRELDEQVPKIRIEDLTGEIEGKEGKTSSVWQTGTPTKEGNYIAHLRIKSRDGKFIEYDMTCNLEVLLNYIRCQDEFEENYLMVKGWLRYEPYKEKN